MSEKPLYEWEYQEEGKPFRSSPGGFFLMKNEPWYYWERRVICRFRFKKEARPLYKQTSYILSMSVIYRMVKFKGHCLDYRTELLPTTLGNFYFVLN